MECYRDDWLLEDVLDVVSRGANPEITSIEDCFERSIRDEVIARWERIELKDQAHQASVKVWLDSLNEEFADGRGGATFRVAVALSVISASAGSLKFTASHRQIAELAAVGTATVNGADTRTVRATLKRLRDLGWIKLDLTDSTYKTTLISLEVPYGRNYPITSFKSINGANTATSTNTTSQNKGPTLYVCGPLLPNELLSEVFSHSGIGFTAYRVFVPLREMGAGDVSAIHGITAINPRRIRDCLTRLEQIHLVYRDENGVWRPTGVNVDDCLEELGLDHRGRLRRVAFKRQRHHYRARFGSPVES